MATLGDTTVVSLNVLNTITGNGSGITNLNGSNIATGTVPFARLPTGTSASQVAIGNHAHTLTLALDSGTATVTLEANKTYKLTAGGNNVIFKTPVDTKNTAGSTNQANTLLYLVGAGSQAANPQTYSNANVYIGTDNCLYSNGTKVSVVGHTHSYAGSASAGGPANSAKELEMRFYKSSEASTAVGYYKIATITHTNWSYCSFTMFTTNSYSGDKFNTLFDMRCADNANSLNSFAFNIIGGTDISSKLKYLETKDGDNTTKIEIFMLCSRYEHPKFYLVTSSTSAGLELNATNWGDNPDKASDATMTGSATNTVKASALTVNAGSGTQPVYFANGVPTATTYALNKTVPSDAVFTDTKNTAGATDGSPTGDAKLYLIGAGSQGNNPQTYTDAKVYIGAGDKLYSNNTEVVVTTDSRLSNARTPTSHASSDTTYGIGTTSKYGHVKLATGDMNGASNEDGVAVSKNHTHSQYSTTDTKNTAGSTASNDKLFLIGAGSQGNNPQTYSNANVFMKNGTLFLARDTDLSGTADNRPALIVGTGLDANGDIIGAHIEVDSNEVQAKATKNTTAPLYLNNDGGNTYLSGSKTYSDGTYLYSNSTKVLTAHQAIYNLGITVNSETSAAFTYDPNNAVANWTIKPSTTAGAFIITDGTTSKTIQLVGTFTDNDTKNTAGATGTNDKLFLIGAPNQNANPQTYSNSNVWTQSGKLYALQACADGFVLKRDGIKATMQYNTTEDCVEFIFA